MDKVHFTAGFFARNRARLRKSVDGGDPIVVTSNGQVQRTSDTTFPFRQDSNFWYLTGLDDPDILLVIDEVGEYLIVASRSESREAFDGTVDPDRLAQISGIETVLDDETGWLRLESSLTKYKSIATIPAPPLYIEQHGMYTNAARLALQTRLQTQQPGLEVIDLRPQLTLQRAIKQPEELAAIQYAIDITIDSIIAITDTEKLRSYAYEYEIEANLGREFRYRGAAGHAFAPIIAGGKRACTLHNVANNAPLTKGEIIILDVGAEVANYAADISRTISAWPPSSRQQSVFDAVLEAQNFALTLLKPGALLRECEKQVESYLGDKLCELGLISSKNAVTQEIRKYYPHSSSHFLGLDVHDVGNYDQPLEAGMVLTCEPGIYIMPESIGVRLEDDILITKTGNSVLSARLPKTLEPVSS